MKLGLVLGGVLLAMPGLVSCGGDDVSSGGKGDAKGAREPTAVSVEDFCAAAEKFENSFTEADTVPAARGARGAQGRGPGAQGRRHA